MPELLEQSLARFVTKVRNVLELYYTPTAWADLSNEKHGLARLFSEFLEPYAGMHEDYINTSKLTNAAFHLRQQLTELKERHELRTRGLLASPATLPTRGESRIPLTATPSQEQLDAAIRSGQQTVAVLSLIKLGVLSQLHQSKMARKKHPGLFARLTFSGIHSVGQYEGILSAVDRSCTGFLKICEFTKGMPLTTDSSDPNFICLQLIELIADMLWEITFDRELIRFNQKYHLINHTYFFQNGVSLLTDGHKAMLRQVTNTFYSWLVFLATRTMNLEETQDKCDDLQEAFAALEEMHERNKGFPGLGAVIGAENLRKFRELQVAFKKRGITPSLRTEPSPFELHEFEAQDPLDVFDAVTLINCVDSDSGASVWDPNWGAVTPQLDASGYFDPDAADLVPETPQASEKTRSTDLDRTVIRGVMAQRSPRATTKLFLG